ncbi:MAG: MBL fold metallo-hydrolase [Gammaproteobacteria bacterium]|nr:MBL fold metallo-hydrolase [Gammaproteobacteria bacterium]MYE28884.1 MBL fold metallo-hydrolase [Gammaproteobacteria bacterium]
MTYMGIPPGEREFELALIGPGYGESIVLHLGAGQWIIVDSCTDVDGQPRALSFLRDMGVDPGRAVALILATHWHDDHIQGIARIVEECPSAQFCCAAALCRKEFVALVGALQGKHLSAPGSGLRELYGVFSLLTEKGQTPTHALANRVVFRHESCAVSALSPSDEVYQRFLVNIGEVIPGLGERKARIPSLSPNEASVALWIDAGEFSLLLGADLERRGWKSILKDEARPAGKASVFKIPHHGSRNAHEPGVWNQLLEERPMAVLAPWRLGGSSLPTRADAERILSHSGEAWITNADPKGRSSPRRSHRAVERTMRESPVRTRTLDSDPSMIRLRRGLAPGAAWSVELSGKASSLENYRVQ